MREMKYFFDKLKIKTDVWIYNNKMNIGPDWLKKTMKTYTVGGKTGNKSAWGEVYKYEPTKTGNMRDTLFIIKRIKLDNKAALNNNINVNSNSNTLQNEHEQSLMYYIPTLVREAEFGMNYPQAPIARVYAYRFCLGGKPGLLDIPSNHVAHLEIIMENVLLTRNIEKKNNIVSLYSFIHEKKLFNKYDSLDLIPKLHITLLDFYKKTEHFHGDLHFGNIILVLDKMTNMINYIKLIDFGAVTPFKKTNIEALKKASTVGDVFPLMENAFNSLKNRNNFNSCEKHWGKVICWLLSKTAVMPNLRDDYITGFGINLNQIVRKSLREFDPKAVIPAVSHYRLKNKPPISNIKTTTFSQIARNLRGE
jgi:hypothetical protein